MPLRPVVLAVRRSRRSPSTGCSGARGWRCAGSAGAIRGTRAASTPSPGRTRVRMRPEAGRRGASHLGRHSRGIRLDPRFFYAIIPNAGIAIIMLTIVVRLILFPLTAKQAKSMIAMQRAQPEIKKLQAKYKNDKQKLNEELMKFYKENKINPLGGCLPLLAQMPVFIALYQTLNEIQHFIPIDSSMYADICSRRGNCKVVNLDFFGMNLTQSASSAPTGFGNALPYFVLVGLVVVTAFLQQRQTMRNQTQVEPADADHRQGHAGGLRVHLDQHPRRCGPLLLHQQPLADRSAGGGVPDHRHRAGPPKGKGDKGKGGGKLTGDRGQEHGDPARLAVGSRACSRAWPRDRPRRRTRRRPTGNGKPQPSSGGSGTKGGSGTGTKKAKSPPAAGKKPVGRLGQRLTIWQQREREAPEQSKAKAIDGVGGDNRPDGRRSARLRARRARGARRRRRDRGPRGTEAPACSAGSAGPTRGCASG